MCKKARVLGISMTDDKDILSLRSCVMIKDPNEDLYPLMEKLMKKYNKYYIEKIEIQTKEFNDVRVRIQESLYMFANQVGGRIQGPVFALIFQAPYYRDLNAQNPVIHLQPFNAHEYQFRPMLMTGDAKNAETESMYKGNLMQVFLFFPMYTPTKQPFGTDMSESDQEKYVNGCLAWFLKQSKLTETICRMRCPSDPSTFCGCINTRVEKGAPYTSVCLGPNDADDYQKSTYVNYGMLYRINEKHAILKTIFNDRRYVFDMCDKPSADADRGAGYENNDENGNENGQ